LEVQNGRLEESVWGLANIEISRVKTEVCECKKGKAVPQQARCGPEGSRRFRLPDFMTFGT